MKQFGLKQILLSLGGFGLIIGALMLAGAVPTEALQTVLDRALMRPAGWRDILAESTPLILLGASVFLALKAGLFNIGADGQFVVGAMASVWICQIVSGPASIALAIVVGTVAGGLWALPAGLIKAHRNGHEVITTIMLNNIAGFFSIYAIRTWLQDPKSQSPTTPYIAESSQLPLLFSNGPFRLSSAFIIALLCVVSLWWFFKKSVAGYEVNAVGANPTAAKFAGINVARVTIRAMTASGMIAGLAGAVQVLAYTSRFYPGFSPGYGFDALGVALLAGGAPAALLGSGILFGAIAKSTTVLAIAGIPKGLSFILLGVLIVVFAGFRYRMEAVRD